MFEESKNCQEYLLHKAYLQLTKGCKRSICLNPYCYSNPSFPKLSTEECKEYVLYLASIESRTLSKSPYFVFCAEPSTNKAYNLDIDSNQGFLVFFSNIENIGLLFLTGPPTSLDPMIN